MGRVFFNTRKNVHSLTAAYTVLASDSGKDFILDAAAGVAITLPSAANMGNGWNCRFIVGTAFGTTNWQITATAAVIKGGINELEDAAGEDGPSTVAGTTVDFVYSLETVGDYVDFMCDGTTIFMRGQSKLDGGILLA
jgi:hypothetical protein